MTLETVATAYVIGAVAWLPIFWASIFWMMRARVPEWEALEDSVDQVEMLTQRPAWPRMFAHLCLGSVFCALTWPYWFCKVALTVAKIVVHEARKAWRERGRP